MGGVKLFRFGEDLNHGAYEGIPIGKRLRKLSK